MAFLFNFHLDCGKHFLTFSKEIEIAQICLEGKKYDLIGFLNFHASANIMVDINF